MTLKFNTVLEVVKVHVRAKVHFIKLSAAVHESYSALDFVQLLDFDREYLSNGSSNQQAENGVINYDFSTVDKINLVNSGPLTKK